MVLTRGSIHGFRRLIWRAGSMLLTTSFSGRSGGGLTLRPGQVLCCPAFLSHGEGAESVRPRVNSALTLGEASVNANQGPDPLNQWLLDRLSETHVSTTGSGHGPSLCAVIRGSGPVRNWRSVPEGYAEERRVCGRCKPSLFLREPVAFRRLVGESGTFSAKSPCEIP